MASVAKLIERMRYWCVEANMGYSQSDRWNFNPAGGNCDCSSLVIHCLQEAGFDTGGASYTGNLSANLTARGWARVGNNGNPQPGDILLNDADHVAVYLGGGKLAQASHSENNSTVGAPGDQTGGETNIRNYYNFPWNCYLRWTGPNDATNEGEGSVSAKDLYDTRDQDGRNVFDHAHQILDNLQGSARQALIDTKGNDGRNVLDGVIQARNEIAALKAMLQEQSATLAALSKAAGVKTSAKTDAGNKSAAFKIE